MRENPSQKTKDVSWNPNTSPMVGGLATWRERSGAHEYFSLGMLATPSDTPSVGYAKHVEGLRGPVEPGASKHIVPKPANPSLVPE